MHCAYCGSAVRPGAPWCGLCLHPVPPPEPPEPEVAEPAYVPPPAYAVALPAARGPLPPPLHPDPEPPLPLPTATEARMMLAGGTTIPERPPPPEPGAPPEPPPAPPARSAGLATFLAIAVGGVSQVVFWLLTRGTVENEAMIRYALVTTLGVYLVVAVIVVRRVAADDHPLRWRGAWPAGWSAAFGAAFGGLFAGGLMALASAAGGSSGDSRLAILVSEADVPHVAATVLIACVAAPLLEEVLFRGLLLASTLQRGTRFAVWVSSAAFSVWHLDPAHFKYYVFMGVVFAALYLRLGLACSVGAHAAFNGVLVAAAIGYALSPGPIVTAGALTVTAPRGWHQVTDDPDYADVVALRGPSGAELLAIDAPPGTPADVDQLWTRFATGYVPGLAGMVQARGETARPVDLPTGRGVRVRIVVEGRDGDLVMLPSGDDVYLVLLISGGSPRVRADFDRILEDLRVS